MTRPYVHVGLLVHLRDPESVPVYECPDDAALVVNTEVHDWWHAAQKRAAPCRCALVDAGQPGAYCGAHDRAAPYPGRPVRGES